MFIRKLDCLSPSITLYYKGENSHSSIFSGILTIIVYSICLTFGVIYAIQFINKSNPQVCYYNRYVEDAGEFPVNSSSMFNFIQILDTEKNIPDIVDFDLVSIIGLQETVDLYQEDNDLSKYNHWVYGPCNNSTDTEGINELINFEHFTESACIRKYYDKNDQKYYETNDQNFKWPIIMHGCSHPNRTFYGIIMEKCRNTTLKLLSDEKYCKPKEEIIEYIKKRSINFLLIDQFTDILNFTTPYRKYFYSISNGLFEDSYTTNHLNLNPSKLISDEGTFFEYKKDTLSYFFDLNEKITSNAGDSGIYVAFYFWMQNRMQYYERVYEKAQDVLSDVGGLCSIVLTLAELINFFVNKYICLFDSQNYINEIEKSKIFDKNIIRFKTNDDFIKIINQNYDKLCPPKNRIIQLNNQLNNNSDSLNRTKISKEEIDILYDKKVKSINKNKNKKNRYSLSTKFLDKNKYLNNANINNDNNNIRKTINGVLKKTSKDCAKDKSDYRSNDNINIININNNINGDRNNNIIIHKEKNIFETHESKDSELNNNRMKFIHYLMYLICLTKRYSYINYYEYFRIRMISEENLIMNYLNIEKIKKGKIENITINNDFEKNPNLNFNNA